MRTRRITDPTLQVVATPTEAVLTRLFAFEKLLFGDVDRCLASYRAFVDSRRPRFGIATWLEKGEQTLSACYTLCGSRDVHMSCMLATHPRFRRQGLAARVATSVIERLKADGVQYFVVRALEGRSADKIFLQLAKPISTAPRLVPEQAWLGA